MATVSVAVLGLGRVGASAALALKRYNESKEAQHTFDIICADLRAGIREDAAKIGLKAERDFFNAAAGRDIVLFAMPYADVREAYRMLAQTLRAGAVVLDVSPLKTPSLAWAGEYLPPGVHVVGATPIVNPRYLFDGLDDTAHAAADLFDKGALLLMPSAACVPDAVALASDFAHILGAAPHFVDPAEHDSLIAATDELPGLLGLVLFYMASRNRGWSDLQRLTNPPFGRLTHTLFDTHPDDLRDVYLNNRDNLLRSLDEYLETLQRFRAVLARGDRAALEAALIEASDAYSQWINRRHQGKWDESQRLPDRQSFGSLMMDNLIGGFVSRRLGGRKEKDE